MIFSKNVTFPYPLFSPFSEDYVKGVFDFQIEDVYDNNDEYRFEIKYELDHPFFSDLIKKNLAKLYFVIDNVTYFYFELTSNYFNVSKKRIALNKRTRFQILIITKEKISFKNNSYLDPIYRVEGEHIIIEANQTIALSNVITYDGEMKKPYDLFNFKVDENMKEEVKVEINNEIITIVYSDIKYKYDGFVKARHLNNHYVYLGLTKALMSLVNLYGGEHQEIVIADQETFNEELNKKILSLLQIYKVEILTNENIDEVIHQISDKVLLKHFLAIKEMNKNED